jgi:pyridoxal phosphate enzyme (YggS family)
VSESVATLHARVEERIERACQAAGRKREEVLLIGVTKFQSVDRVRELIATGVYHLGENYVQELVAKKEALSDPRACFHFIGGLQTNKVKQLIGHTVLIHAVDSEKLCREIAKRALEKGFAQTVLIAVSAAGEAQKSGVAPSDVEALLERMAATDGISCQGFMTMPPVGPAEASRPYFEALRALRDRLARNYPQATHLSMGMSDDFEVAIACGATMIRVGTALVGPREQPAHI